MSNTQVKGHERKGRERFVFLTLAGVVAPFLVIGVVAGIGFAIWLLQMFTGPPVA